MHYCKTDPSLFTTGAPQVFEESSSESGMMTVSDWPEQHCVFALWKRVSSGGYALTFVHVVEGTFSAALKSICVNQECALY
jgi:hypothetical protein